MTGKRVITLEVPHKHLSSIRCSIVIIYCVSSGVSVGLVKNEDLPYLYFESPYKNPSLNFKILAADLAYKVWSESDVTQGVSIIEIESHPTIMLDFHEKLKGISVVECLQIQLVPTVKVISQNFHNLYGNPEAVTFIHTFTEYEF